MCSKIDGLGIQQLFGDEPTFFPRKTAGRVRSGFVQIDQSAIRLPRLSRRNNYINYLCLHFWIHFTFFTWYLLRTFSGMFCVTDIAFFVLQKYRGRTRAHPRTAAGYRAYKIDRMQQLKTWPYYVLNKIIYFRPCHILVLYFGRILNHIEQSIEKRCSLYIFFVYGHLMFSRWPL